MPTCSICKLFVNSEMQMVAHRTGKTHLTKLKELGMNPDIMGKDRKDTDIMRKESGTYTTPTNTYDQSYYGGSFVKQGDQGNYGGLGDGGPTFMSSPVNSMYTDPVGMAVQDNAYGRLPTKRKAVTSRCQACDLSFNSTEQASSHYAGSKHAKKLRSTGDVKTVSPGDIPKNIPPGPKHPVSPCEICSVSFTSDLQADAHYKGSKHARHLTAKDTELSCQVCQVSFTSMLQAGAHYKGSKHARHTMQPNESGVTSSDGKSIANFNCPLCNVNLNSQGQYEAHIIGAKHVKLLEKKTIDAEAGPTTSSQ